MYKSIECLIIATINGEAAEEFFGAVTELNGNDFDTDQLSLHPQFLATNFPQEQREAVTVRVVCVYFPKMSKFDNSLLSQDEVC